MSRFGMLALVAIVAGCTIGKPGWNGPGGGSFSYRELNTTVGGVGELIAARDSSVVVLHPTEGVREIPWRLLTSASLLTPTRIRLRGLTRPSATQLQQLRYYSRYPRGLADDELARLIEATRPHDALGHGPVTVDSLVTRFLDRARAAGDALAVPAAAIARGYRALGPDFPGMGEHWVHLGLAISPIIDASRPALLSYAPIAGEMRLVSVAYTIPLRPGEAMPEVPGIPPEAWHDHSSSVDEETLIVSSPATHETTGDEPRVAMAHAWLWVENPDGVFAQNNWALPFLRIGIAPPEGVGPAAARALALADSAGASLHQELVRRLADAPASLDPSLGRIIAEHSARAARVASRLRASGEATDGDVAELTAIWERLGDALARSLPPASADRVTAFHRASSH